MSDFTAVLAVGQTLQKLLNGAIASSTNSELSRR